MKIHLSDVPKIIELINLGAGLVFRLLEADAMAAGRTEITDEDLAKTRLRLDHVLSSGRSVGQLRDRLKEIAEGA